LIDKRDGKQEKAKRKRPRTPTAGVVNAASDTSPTGQESAAEKQEPSHSVSDDAIIGLTRALVWWTGILALATIALSIAAVFQWRELRSTDHNIAEQVKITAEQLSVMRAGQRAWVSVGQIEVGGGLTIKDGKASAILKIPLKNTGNVPAIRVVPVIHLYPGYENFADLPPTCLNNDAARAGLGLMIFPNETPIFPTWIWDVTTEGGGASTPLPKEGSLSLNVRGCVLYQSAGDDAVYRTTFAGFLIRRGVGVDEGRIFSSSDSRYERLEIEYVSLPMTGWDAR
jgi:hypothetical protein